MYKKIFVFISHRSYHEGVIEKNKVLVAELKQKISASTSAIQEETVSCTPRQ